MDWKKEVDRGEGRSEYCTTVGAARYLGLSVGSLQNMRQKQEGPPYRKISPRRILYRYSDLDKYAWGKTGGAENERAFPGESN